MSNARPNIAIVLSGCGFLDGSEIHESVSVLIHLSRLGAIYHCFAPDAEQAHVVDHMTGEIEPRRQRNMLNEAARIARGKAHVSPLAQLDASKFDAIIFPGGFGAAKNLSTFAVDGADCDVLPGVEKVIKTFHAAGKPIGMCCIAPVLAARVLGRRPGFEGSSIRITLGAEGAAAAAVRALGATHVVKPVTEALVDEESRLVTSPAYMYDAAPHDVFVGIGKMVEGVLALIASPAPAHAR